MLSTQYITPDMLDYLEKHMQSAYNYLLAASLREERRQLRNELKRGGYMDQRRHTWIIERLADLA